MGSKKPKRPYKPTPRTPKDQDPHVPAKYMENALSDRMYAVMGALTEGDRGTILVVGAIIDETLGDLLEAYFRFKCRCSDETIINGLLVQRPMPPLGSMWVRTNLCFALGLITEEVWCALNVMRDIRNKFAHTADPAELPDDLVKDMLLEFGKNFLALIKSQGDVLRAISPGPLCPPGVSENRWAFVSAANYLHQALVASLFNMTPTVARHPREDSPS